MSDNQRKVALVIGNDAYEGCPRLLPLSYAVSDAQAMRDCLEDLGFEVIQDIPDNQDKATLRTTLRRFRQELNPDDIALVYLAGHGASQGNEHYFLPIDARIEDGADLRDEGLALAEIEEVMIDRASEINIFLLDICRTSMAPSPGLVRKEELSVPSPDDLVSRGWDPDRSTKSTGYVRGLARFFAAAENRPAHESARRQGGVFTETLLKMIRTPGLSLEDLYKQVAKEIQEVQQPELKLSTLYKQFFFVKPVRPRYFTPVYPDIGPGLKERRFNLIPTGEDYRLGRVHRPALMGEVMERLRGPGRGALVRGHGASGKSVLAWLMALDWVKEGKAAYMLDIKGRSLDTYDVLKELREYGNDETLFVLDNCHLDESFVLELLGAWREEIPTFQRPRLLVLGREIRDGGGQPINGFRLPGRLTLDPLPLRAKQPELKGIYGRLMAHEMGEDAPPEPPKNVLDDWVRVFGGAPNVAETTTDLIAFSMAVWERRRQLLRANWALSEQDAEVVVEAAYLVGLEEGEKENLRSLAAVECLDLALPLEGLPHQAAEHRFKTCMEVGLVFSREEDKSYRLAHAALGRLLLTAMGVTAKEAAKARCDAATRNPEFFFILLNSPELTRQLDAKFFQNDEATLIYNSFIDNIKYSFKCKNLVELNNILYIADHFKIKRDLIYSRIDCYEFTTTFYRLLSEEKMENISIFIENNVKNNNFFHKKIENFFSKDANFRKLIEKIKAEPIEKAISISCSFCRVFYGLSTKIITLVFDEKKVHEICDNISHISTYYLSQMFIMVSEFDKKAFSNLEKKFISDASVREIMKVLYNSRASELVYFVKQIRVSSPILCEALIKEFSRKENFLSYINYDVKPYSYVKKSTYAQVLSKEEDITFIRYEMLRNLIYKLSKEISVKLDQSILEKDILYPSTKIMDTVYIRSFSSVENVQYIEKLVNLRNSLEETEMIEAGEIKSKGIKSKGIKSNKIKKINLRVLISEIRQISNIPMNNIAIENGRYLLEIPIFRLSFLNILLRSNRIEEHIEFIKVITSAEIIALSGMEFLDFIISDVQFVWKTVLTLTNINNVNCELNIEYIYYIFNCEHTKKLYESIIHHLANPGAYGINKKSGLGDYFMGFPAPLKANPGVYIHPDKVHRLLSEMERSEYYRPTYERIMRDFVAAIL